MRLANYSQGACANVGANRPADRLKRLQEAAAGNAFDDGTASLQSLVEELDRLRHEARAQGGGSTSQNGLHAVAA